MPRFREVLAIDPYRDPREFVQESEPANVDGSAISKSFWQERTTRERWYAKSDVCQEDYQAETSVFLESCANKIYAYYGVTVARLAIAVLPISCDLQLYGLPRSKTTATHLLSRWIDRFNCYGESNLPPFIAQLDGEFKGYFQLMIGEQKIIEQGLGQILAIAHFINDIDVIGGSGKNIGYKLIAINGNLQVLSCKIDPGNAFYGFRGLEEPPIGTNITKKIRIATNGALKDVEVAFECLPQHTQLEFVATLRDIANTPVEDLAKIFEYCHNPRIKPIAKNIIQLLKERQKELKSVFVAEMSTSKFELTTSFMKLSLETSDTMLQQMYAHNLFANQDFIYKQSKEFYIDLHAACSPYNQGKPPLTFALHEATEQFLQSTEQKLLVLLGDGGSGKSIYVQMLREKLWKKFDSDVGGVKWVPIHIELKRFSKKTVLNCVRNTLIDDYKLSYRQIEDLQKNYNCLIIMDGFDEIEAGLKCDLRETNQLKALWPQTKLIITCRTDYLDAENVSRYLSTSAETDIVRYLTPFSQEQIISYLNKYISSVDWSNILSASLIALLGVPLLLRIFKDAWPMLVDEILKAGLEKNLNTFKIYTAFMEEWFSNNQARLNEIEGVVFRNPDKMALLTRGSFDEYSQELAFCMHEQEKFLITKSDMDVWSKFFSSSNPKTIAARMGCPLRKSDKGYSFIHKSFQEYFVARKILGELISGQYSSLTIKSLVQMPAILNFIAQCLSKPLQELLFKIILQSRDGLQQSTVAAANAATILNTAKIAFSGRDLHGVNISGANLTGAILDHTKLQGANLSNVILKTAWLQCADLRDTNMLGVVFGELSSLKARDCAYSHDNNYFACIDERNIKLFALSSQRHSMKLIKNLTVSEYVCNPLFHPNNQWFACVGHEKIYLWSLAQLINDAQKTLKNQSTGYYGGGRRGLCYQDNEDMATKILTSSVRINSFTFSPDGKWLAAASGNDHYSGRNSGGAISLWSLSFNDEFTLKSQTIIRHTRAIRAVIFSPNSQWLTASLQFTGAGDENKDNAVYLWSVDGSTKRKLSGPEHRQLGPASVSFSMDGQWLVTAAEGPWGRVQLWNLIDHTKNQTLIDDKTINCLAFSPDSQWIVMGTHHNKVIICNLIRQPIKIDIFTCHDSSIYHVAFSPDSKWFASGGYVDKKVCLWSVSDLSRYQILHGHSDGIRSVVFSSNSQLLTSGDDRELRFWNVKESWDNFNSYQLVGHTGRVNNVAFSPDGHNLASCEDNGYGGQYNGNNAILVWNLKNLEVVKIATEPRPINQVVFSPDSQWLASCSGCAEDALGMKETDTVRLWNLTNHTKNRILVSSSTTPVYDVCFSFDGQWLASRNNYSRPVYLWNLMDPTKNKTILRENDYTVNDDPFNIYLSDTDSVYVKFSPNNEWLAVTSEKPTWRSEPTSIYLFNLLNPVKNRICTGHTDYICCINFSLDGRWLASGSRDYSVRVWEMEALLISSNIKFEKNQVLSDHKRKVNSISFSYNSQWLASASDDQTICVWGKSLTGTDKDNWGKLFSVQTNFCVNSLVYSPISDRLLLATGGDDHSVRLWEQLPDKIVLLWHTHHKILYVHQAEITGAMLSVESYELLKQRGAVGEPSVKDESLLLFSEDCAITCKVEEHHGENVYTKDIESDLSRINISEPTVNLPSSPFGRELLFSEPSSRPKAKPNQLISQQISLGHDETADSSRLSVAKRRALFGN